MIHRLVWSLATLLAFTLGDTAQLTAQVQLASRAPRFVRVSPVTRRLVDASHATILKRQMSLSLDRSSLADALDEISRTAGINLIYSRDLVPLDTPVTLQAATISLGAALMAVLFDTGLDVVISSNGEMALMKKVPLSPVARAPTGSVSGRVTDVKTSAAIPGATVVIERTSLSATTDNDGRYRITEVPAGTYTVRVRYIGYAPGTASVTVSQNQETTADFALKAAPTQLEEIVTTGTLIPTEVKALPTPITVVTAEDIAERRPKALLDVIRQVVPTAVAFDVPFYPMETDFSVRGTSSLAANGQMKIFVDGVEAASFGVSPVDPNSIERIEVVRGPQAATLYGADAAGGVVQIFTKRGDPNLTRPGLNAQAEMGIQQTPYAGRGGVLRQRYVGAVRGGTQEASYNFGGSYTHLADYVPPDETSRQVTPSVYGGMRFTSGIVTADLSARYYRHKLRPVLSPLAFTAGFAPNSRPLYQIDDFTNETYGAQITLSPNGWWRNQVTLGADRETFQQTQTRPRLTTAEDTLRNVSDGSTRKISIGFNSSVTASLTHRVTGSLTVGLDHYDNHGENAFTFEALNTEGTIQTSPPGSFGVSRNTVTNTGYFAQIQVGMAEAVFLTAGLRADDNSTFGRSLGTPVLPRVGLSVIHALKQVTLKARGSYGEAIRAPAPGQGNGAAGSFAIQLENPLLGPERQRGWDAGIDVFFGNRASLSVTGYDQTATDLIGLVTLAFTPTFTYQFQNIGRVANSGVEIEGTLTVHPLRLKAQYGYVRSRVEDLGPGVSPDADLQVGDQPLRGPRHTAGATLTVVPHGGTALVAGLTYVGRNRYYDILELNRCLGGTGPCPDSFLSSGTTRDFIVEYPGFAKFNASLTQRLTRELEGFISVDNLTNNESYEAGTLSPVLGRLTMVGLQVSY
jgi:outer membrane receptor protein involved in Fe transport